MQFFVPIGGFASFLYIKCALGAQLKIPTSLKARLSSFDKNEIKIFPYFRSLEDKKARKCPHCEKTYVSMPAYSMHIRTHNQGCKCPYCGKCFSRPWLLQGHIRTHTGKIRFYIGEQN